MSSGLRWNRGPECQGKGWWQAIVWIGFGLGIYIDFGALPCFTFDGDRLLCLSGSLRPYFTQP
jgi:hypothetical protein